MDERLKALAATLSDAELATLVAEARAAALAEVRAQLKQAYVEHILERLGGGPVAMAVPTTLPGTAALGEPSMAAPAVPATPTAPDDAALVAELAALKAQLAANRSWLHGAAETPQAAHDLQSAPTPEASLARSPAHASSPSPRQLLWVYAVRRVGAPLPEAIPGVVAGEPLQPIVWADLEALVSLVPSDTFSAEQLEANVRDLDWLEPVARAHQHALTALMNAHQAPEASSPTPQSPLVPMRFATLFTSPERVAAMLAERAEELRAALAFLEGRGEWGVKLFVNEATLAERLADASPAVRELRENIAAKPAGAAYMLQKRLERLSAEEARRVGDGVTEEAHARLSAVAVAARRAPLRDAQGEELLLNGAYLVAGEDYPSFTGTLDELRAEYEPLGFRFELSGPWPAYSFASPQPEAVEAHVGGQA